MIDTLSRTPTLKAYPCQQWNDRQKKPCEATVIDAYAPAGAIVRRKCGVCGNWNLIRVEPDPVLEASATP